MHQLLEKLLQKREINSVNDLNQEEKVQFDTWQKTLSEGEMSVDKIGSFCKSQLDIIKGKMKDTGNDNSENDRLIVYFNVYDTLLTLINSPQAEREGLIKYLEQLTK